MTGFPDNRHGEAQCYYWVNWEGSDSFASSRGRQEATRALSCGKDPEHFLL